MIDCVGVGSGKCVPNYTYPHRVLDANLAAIEDQMLTGVVQSGTGKAAQLSGGWSIAGKTGTTENYGDAWFVGFTPDVVTAVWVGYPDSLRPMLSEYHGRSVAGGTYPALIWKTFMDKALANVPPTDFPAPSRTYGVPRRVVWRDGSLQLDNGYCHDTQEIVYMTVAPTRTSRKSPPKYFERSIQSMPPPFDRTVASLTVGFGSPARGYDHVSTFGS